MALWTERFKKRGQFQNDCRVTWRGPLNYEFDTTTGFQFVRSNGQVIKPGAMFTDGGSIPRLLWSMPGLDPWTYFPAYLIHDFLFLANHQGINGATDGPVDFDTANAILTEGIYTLGQDGVAKVNDFDLMSIYEAVSSGIGLKVWNGDSDLLP